MNDNAERKSNASRAQRLTLVALALAAGAHAQSLASPATPTLITPPQGNSAFLLGQAVGTQGYICLPTSAGAPTASWTVKPSRPEATLFQRVFGLDIQIITHFLSPDADPQRCRPQPLALRQRDVAGTR